MKTVLRDRHDQGTSVLGFTLIEMLVVLAIMVVVSALLLPVALRGRSLARESRCKHSLKDLGVAITQDYLNEMIPDTVRLASYRPEASAPPAFRIPPAQPACWPPPPGPPPPAQANQVSMASYPIQANGFRCPEAKPNPLHAMNPADEPTVLSYGFLTYNLGKHWMGAWDWLVADASAAYIVHEMNVDTSRHPHGANILFRDGSVLCLKPGRIPFPPVEL